MSRPTVLGIHTAVIGLDEADRRPLNHCTVSAAT